MHIDSLTLMLPGAFVPAVAGILLCAAYFRLSDQTALLWWSAASLANALGVVVLIVGIANDNTSLMASGTGVTIVAAALFWGAIRYFNKRHASIIALATGLIAWTAAAFLAHAAGLDPHKWSAAASFAIVSAYFVACMWELWSTRDEKLAYRWAMIGFLGLHAAVYTGGIYDVLAGVLILDGAPPVFSWFGMIHLETLVFASGSATILLVLVRERIALDAIKAANSDPLTGAANRRVFFGDAERLFQRCRATDSPMSVVMFDLDHFKQVNDALGHKAGDQVIVGLADIMRAFLRPNDLFTRYGGEEFVLVLPNVSMQAACAIAERVRQTFARTYKFLDGQPVCATVSAGVALANPDEPFETAVQAADTALYAAKHAGRNRIRRADNAIAGDQANVVRIA